MLANSISLLLLAVTAVAQSLPDGPTTSAVCNPTFSWMNNTMGQSPCLLAAYLEGNCGTGFWNINALPVGNIYNGPTANQSNACMCSSVVYNAVSACGACQNEGFATWPAWKQPCKPDDVSVGDYKVSIPPGTSIPRWAYQDPMQQQDLKFNLTLANSVAAQKLPDVTHDTQTGATSTPTTSTSSVPNQGGSKTNVGAIVGGVIGGVALIAGIALLTWYLLQRRYESRASQAPSKQYINKWSKGVVGGPPSRWGGTTYAGGSVAGDPVKERDSMLGTLPSPDSVPYTSSPFGLTSYSTSGPQPTPPEMRQSSNRGGNASNGSSRSLGHKKDAMSGSSTRSKRHLLSSSPPIANGITPYVLPPLDAPTVVSGRRISLETSAPSDRTGAVTPFSSLAADMSHRGPVPAELPSTIEYFGNRRPPMPNPQPQPPMSASRTSLGTSARPGYYNPDDPSTYPLSAIANDYTFSPTSGHPSNGQPPSSTFFPNSSMEKLPFGGMNRPYTPGTSAHGYNASRQQTPALPPLPTGANLSPQDRNPNPLNMNMSLAGSVHTLPGTHSPITPAQRSTVNRTPDPRPPPPEPPVPNSGGIFNSWSKRTRGDDSVPPSTWTPHVANMDPGAEFNPYR